MNADQAYSQNMALDGPASIVTFPPSPSWELPTASSTFPPCDLCDLPVERTISPLAPELATPVVIFTDPETPPLPKPSSAELSVATVTDPELPSSNGPDLISIVISFSQCTTRYAHISTTIRILIMAVTTPSNQFDRATIPTIVAIITRAMTRKQHDITTRTIGGIGIPCLELNIGTIDANF